MSSGAGTPATVGDMLWYRGGKGGLGNPMGVRPGFLLFAPFCAGLVFLVLPVVALALRAIAGQGIDGFIEVLGDRLFLDAIERTLLLAVTVATVCCVIGTAYALALVAVPQGLAYVLLGILLSAFWLSLLVRTFGWVLLFQPNGALDQLLQGLGLIDGSLDLLQTTPAMYPAMIHVMLPFLVLPVYAASLRLDPELLRAAESLGAKPLAIIWHVVLPHLRPAILAGGSLVFMLSLAFYITPLLIGGPANLTIATLIGREFSELYNLVRGATMALLLLIIVLAIYLAVDRFAQLVPDREGQ